LDVGPFQIQNFSRDEFDQPITGKSLDNIEPATGKSCSQVARSDAEMLMLRSRQW
jgi:hypothetical protein